MRVDGARAAALCGSLAHSLGCVLVLSCLAVRLAPLRTGTYCRRRQEGLGPLYYSTELENFESLREAASGKARNAETAPKSQLPFLWPSPLPPWNTSFRGYKLVPDKRGQKKIMAERGFTLRRVRAMRYWQAMVGDGLPLVPPTAATLPALGV